MLTNQIGLMLKASSPALPASSLAIINEETSSAFTESIDAQAYDLLVDPARMAGVEA